MHVDSKKEDTPTLSDTNQFRQYLEQRTAFLQSEEEWLKIAALQLVEAGSELWPKRTKKSRHLNVSCFDPIFSNGNTSATVWKHKKRGNKINEIYFGDKINQNRRKDTSRWLTQPADNNTASICTNIQKNLPLFKEGRLSSSYAITSSVILCWKNKWKIKILWQGE